MANPPPSKCSATCSAETPARKPSHSFSSFVQFAHNNCSDVRRAALLNIPLTLATLPSILSRTRDTDTTNRKLVYSAVLEPHCESLSVGHPRALTITQRELLVRNGLSDREPVVRSAAGSLVGAWVDVVGEGAGAKDKDAKDQASIEQDVVALLKLFDLAESAVAEDALLSVFKNRVDIFDGLEFGGQSLLFPLPQTE